MSKISYECILAKYDSEKDRIHGRDASVSFNVKNIYTLVFQILEALRDGNYLVNTANDIRFEFKEEEWHQDVSMEYLREKLSMFIDLPKYSYIERRITHALTFQITIYYDIDKTEALRSEKIHTITGGKDMMRFPAVAAIDKFYLYDDTDIAHVPKKAKSVDCDNSS